MAKKAPTAAVSPNLTIRLSDADRALFERAAKAEHFDSLSQWVKVHLRRAATAAVSAGK